MNNGPIIRTQSPFISCISAPKNEAAKKCVQTAVSKPTFELNKCLSAGYIQKNPFIFQVLKSRVNNDTLYYAIVQKYYFKRQGAVTFTSQNTIHSKKYQNPGNIFSESSSAFTSQETSNFNQLAKKVVAGWFRHIFEFETFFEINEPQDSSSFKSQKTSKLGQLAKTLVALGFRRIQLVEFKIIFENNEPYSSSVVKRIYLTPHKR